MNSVWGFEEHRFSSIPKPKLIHLPIRVARFLLSVLTDQPNAFLQHINSDVGFVFRDN